MLLLRARRSFRPRYTTVYLDQSPCATSKVIPLIYLCHRDLNYAMFSLFPSSPLFFPLQLRVRRSFRPRKITVCLDQSPCATSEVIPLIFPFYRSFYYTKFGFFPSLHYMFFPCSFPFSRLPFHLFSYFKYHKSLVSSLLAFLNSKGISLRVCTVNQTLGILLVVQ